MLDLLRGFLIELCNHFNLIRYHGFYKLGVIVRCSSHLLRTPVQSTRGEDRFPGALSQKYTHTHKS